QLFSFHCRMEVSRPFGSDFMLAPYPTLKRWAILVRPFGTGSSFHRGLIIGGAAMGKIGNAEDRISKIRSRIKIRNGNGGPGSSRYESILNSPSPVVFSHSFDAPTLPRSTRSSRLPR